MTTMTRDSTQSPAYRAACLNMAGLNAAKELIHMVAFALSRYMANLGFLSYTQ